MRTCTAAITALVLAASLTACGGSDHASSAKPKAAANSNAPKASPSVDCSDTELSQADWIDNCSDKEGDDTGSTTAPADADLKALGKPASTTGDGGTGVMEVTPTTVVFAAKGSGEKPTKDVFAVVAVRDKAKTAVAATESKQISGGGWQWISPDGQAIDEGNGSAYNVVLDDFNAGGTVQPGSFVWDAQVFDLTAAQAKGGTLVYVDGEGTAYRWKAPASDSGPQIAQVKKQLQF